MKFILHMGAHKTATTSIQNMLDDHRAALSTHGYELILPRDSRHIYHREAMTRDAVKVSAFVQNWREEHQDCKHLLHFDENLIGFPLLARPVQEFYPNARSLLKVMKPSFMAKPNEVILTIRNYVSWLPSVYFQLASKKYFNPLTPSLIDEMKNMERGWKSVVQDIQKVFPNAKVTVIPFESLIEDFGRYFHYLYPDFKFDVRRVQHRRETGAFEAYQEWIENLDHPDAENLVRFARKSETGKGSTPFAEGFWAGEDTSTLTVRYFDELAWFEEQGLLFGNDANLQPSLQPS